MYFASKNEMVIFIDEIDKSLHSYLVEHLISMFNDMENNINNSQLIFNTHDTNLLDLITISNLMIKKELKKYDYIYDEKMLNKIYNCVDEMPYPGIMQNIINSSIAFSDAENKYDYLSKIMLSLTGMEDLKDFKKLQEFGFSLRDIEKLTGKPKSSVAREVNNE